MSERRNALARNLCARISDERRTYDELNAIDYIFCRIERGADLIGPLDLATDKRDWLKEAGDECSDLLAYLAFSFLSQQIRRRERLRTFIDDEFDTADLGDSEWDDVTTEYQRGNNEAEQK